jgi:aspartate racemase
MQHGIHLAETRSPIPFLSMTELVAERIQRDQRKCVALIGTKMVMLGSTYQTHLGLRGVRVEVPNPSDADQLDSIIFKELLFGIVRSQSQKRVLDVVKGLADRGCEGVILGCSEAPLLISPENSPLPVYDATDVLAEEAVRCAMGARPLPGRGR